MALRRIVTAEEKAKKSKRNTIIISIVLGLIMILSTAGYFVSDFSNSSTSNIEYKGVTFKQTDYGTWKSKLSGQEIETRFNPTEMENISVSITKTIADYSQTTYFTAEPIEDLPQSSISLLWANLGKFSQRLNLACYEKDCGMNYPVKNCSTNLIVFRQSNLSRISQSDNCINIYSPAGEEEKVLEAFFFKIMGL